MPSDVLEVFRDIIVKWELHGSIAINKMWLFYSITYFIYEKDFSKAQNDN